MWSTLLALALLVEPAAPSARPGGRIPLPPAVPLASPARRVEPAAPAEPPPPEVVALLGQGRTLVEARRSDLDLDGSPEWILVAAFLHPERIDHGPRSAEWRAGQRIESRATHELVLVGREHHGDWRVRFTAELHGSERQALLVERLAGADLKPGRYPAVITGARACAGSCGPLELHVILWDAKRKAFQAHAWTDAEFAVVTGAGTVEAWFADRRPGDPMCCPSGYQVMELAAIGGEVEVRQQRGLPADRLRRLLPPGALIYRETRPAVAPATGPAR